MDDDGIAGSTWLVTGASRGLGAAIAASAIDKGARVVLCDVQDEAGNDLVATLRNAGAEVVYHHCDVTSEPDLAAGMRLAQLEFGGLDVLVNNAGIHERTLDTPELLSMRPDTFRRVLEVNLISVWTATRLAVPLLRESAFPSIINAGSTASFTGYPQASAYGASKGAVGVLTKCLAVDLAMDGIRVNAYCPGATETPMIADLLSRQPDEALARWRSTSSHLVRRYGEPNDIAELVCFLASRRAAFINGALIPIDGGSLAWRGSVDSLGFDKPVGA